jgi:hypothetical protein
MVNRGVHARILKMATIMIFKEELQRCLKIRVHRSRVCYKKSVLRQWDRSTELRQQNKIQEIHKNIQCYCLSNENNCSKK